MPLRDPQQIKPLEQGLERHRDPAQVVKLPYSCKRNDESHKGAREGQTKHRNIKIDMNERMIYASENLTSYSSAL